MPSLQLRRWVLPFALFLSARARAAEPMTGARFDALAAGAVDVMRLHQWTLKAQMDRDEAARVYEASLRSMHGEFVDIDGNVIESDLARFIHTNWFGDGDPRTGQAWFAGMQIDGALIGSGSLSNLVYNGQLLVFAGYAREGWQGSLGLRGDHHQGVHADGTFVQGLSVSSDGTDARGGGAGLIASVQHAEGAAFGAVFDSRGLSVSGDRKDAVSALRALLQPEAAMERAHLRKAGVPLLSVERIGAGIDPWAERDPGDPAAPAVYQVPLALDDIGGIGLRARVVPEIAPQPGLRLAEGAFTWIGHGFAFGGRAGAWRSRGSWDASAEGYATLIASYQDGGDEGLAFTLSAAHNVPDTATFFAIPGATVFGLGVTYGPLDLTRAAIPVLASQARRGK